MVIEKGLVTAAVVTFAGLVGYKIIQKKSPAAIKKVKKFVSGITKRTTEIIENAKESFREGYAHAA